MSSFDRLARLARPVRLVRLALATLTLVPALASCWPTGGKTGSSTGGSGGTTTMPQTAPPVIDSLDLASPALVSADGAFYVISGSVTYHDDDDVIESGGVYVPVIGKTIPITIPPEYQTAIGAGIPLSFQVSDDIPLTHAGPTSFVVTFTNKSGAVSTGWNATVDLP